MENRRKNLREGGGENEGGIAKEMPTRGEWIPGGRGAQDGPAFNGSSVNRGGQ
jgi:hypothetical protein